MSRPRLLRHLPLVALHFGGANPDQRARSKAFQRAAADQPVDEAFAALPTLGEFGDGVGRWIVHGSDVSHPIAIMAIPSAELPGAPLSASG